jgi:hypothetical protein
LFVNIHPLPTTPARENEGAVCSGVIGQQVPGRGIQGYLLVNPALGGPEMDKTPLKIHVLPLQPEDFPPAHAGK